MKGCDIQELIQPKTGWVTWMVRDRTEEFEGMEDSTMGYIILSTLFMFHCIS
jgi:hypothetical protein